MSDWLDGFYPTTVAPPENGNTLRAWTDIILAPSPARIMPPSPISATEDLRYVRHAGQYYIGIDPGLTGFIAVLTPRGRIVETRSTPAIIGDEGHPVALDRDGMLALAREWAGRAALVMIEKQQTMPDNGPVGNFTTGFGYGLWIMALHAAGLTGRYEEIAPGVWKEEMKILLPRAAPGTNKGLDLKTLRRNRAQRKKFTKAKAVAEAQRRFPGYDLRATTHPRAVPSPDKAEALLLATLARRRHGNAD